VQQRLAGSALDRAPQLRPAGSQGDGRAAGLTGGAAANFEQRAVPAPGSGRTVLLVSQLGGAPLLLENRTARGELDEMSENAPPGSGEAFQERVR